MVVTSSNQVGDGKGSHTQQPRRERIQYSIIKYELLSRCLKQIITKIKSITTKKQKLYIKIPNEYKHFQQYEKTSKYPNDKAIH